MLGPKEAGAEITLHRPGAEVTICERSPSLVNGTSWYRSYSRVAYVCNRMHQHLCARKKSQTLEAFVVWRNENTAHTLVGTGSAALAAAVPYPVKATPISRKAQ